MNLLNIKVYVSRCTRKNREFGTETRLRGRLNEIKKKNIVFR